jgi:hypothetical protein
VTETTLELFRDNQGKESSPQTILSSSMTAVVIPNSIIHCEHDKSRGQQWQRKETGKMRHTESEYEEEANDWRYRISVPIDCHSLPGVEERVAGESIDSLSKTSILWENGDASKSGEGGGSWIRILPNKPKHEKEVAKKRSREDGPLNLMWMGSSAREKAKRERGLIKRAKRRRLGSMQAIQVEKTLQKQAGRERATGNTKEGIMTNGRDQENAILSSKFLAALSQGIALCDHNKQVEGKAVQKYQGTSVSTIRDLSTSKDGNSIKHPESRSLERPCFAQSHNEFALPLQNYSTIIDRWNQWQLEKNLRPDVRDYSVNALESLRQQRRRSFEQKKTSFEKCKHEVQETEGESSSSAKGKERADEYNDEQADETSEHADHECSKDSNRQIEDVLVEMTERCLQEQSRLYWGDMLAAARKAVIFITNDTPIGILQAVVSSRCANRHRDPPPTNVSLQAYRKRTLASSSWTMKAQMSIFLSPVE